MARLARLAIPGYPYHVTQRGNRRQPTFFEDGDDALYLALSTEASRRAGAAVWAYCLMPNYVHVVALLSNMNGLRVARRDIHRRQPALQRLHQRMPPLDWHRVTESLNVMVTRVQTQSAG